MDLIVLGERKMVTQTVANRSNSSEHHKENGQSQVREDRRGRRLLRVVRDCFAEEVTFQRPEGKSQAANGRARRQQLHEGV